MNQPQPRYWRKLERHPLSADYENIEGPAWEQFVADVREHGVVNKRRITLVEDKVLDGWQLQRACVEANVRPDYQGLPKGIDAESFVRICNDNRRHESPELAMQRAAMRRERVAAARAQGQSLRTIAEAEGISKTQVIGDLTAAGDSPESPEKNGTPRPPRKVKGKDGKEYPATPQPKIIDELQAKIDAGQISPKLVPELATLSRDQQTTVLEGMAEGLNPRKAINLAQVPPREPGDEGGPKAPKNGRVQYDYKVYKQCMGGLHREVTRLSKAFGVKDCKIARELIDSLDIWDKDFREWHAELKEKAKEKVGDRYRQDVEEVVEWTG